MSPVYLLKNIIIIVLNSVYLKPGVMSLNLNCKVKKNLIPILALSFLALGNASSAARMVEVGESTKATLDKAYIDLDSITQEGRFRIATFLTVYEKARKNSHGITLDRHEQKTAFDCQAKQFALVYTIGYFEGKQIATSPVNTNWKDTLKNIPSDAFEQRSMRIVCGIASAGAQNLANVPQKISKPVTTPTERLVLMPIRVPDEDRNLKGTMETALVKGLQTSYVVYSGERVAQKAHEIFMKESKDTSHIECDETRCMQNIATAFQSELIATANVTKQDGGYFLAISICKYS